jgi:hypothetical protein
VSPLEEFGKELTISPWGPGWVLTFRRIAGGSVYCRDRAILDAIADGYATGRRSGEAPQPGALEQLLGRKGDPT